jgi:hypothetical protein
MEWSSALLCTVVSYETTKAVGVYVNLKATHHEA